MKKILNKNKKSIKYPKNQKKILLYSCIGLFILSPLIKLFFFDRYYDKEQFFVSDSNNYEVGLFAEIGNQTIEQSFLARDNNISGFDIQFSGSKAFIRWKLIDAEQKIINEGEIKNAGEGRISKIRFEPIKNVSGDKFSLIFIDLDEENGVMISYSNKEYCNDCLLIIDGNEINGNINFVPVYKANDFFEFSKILFERIKNTIIVD